MNKLINVLSFSALLLSSYSYAYHYPWDQGHDTTLPNYSNHEPGTGQHESEESNCETGSPVYLKTGHFVWGDVDIALGDISPLQVRRVYNSNDPKDGPFGKGWTFNCEVSLYKVTDLVETAEGSIPVSKYVYRVGNGRRLIFEQNSSGGYTAPSRLQATLTEGNQTKLDFANGKTMMFASSGHVTSTTDRNGNTVVYTYDTSKRLIGISNDFSQSLTFTYNVAGRVQSVTDNFGRSWLYGYSSKGELVSVTNPLGNDYTYQYHEYRPSYDAQSYSQLDTITDPTGVVVASVIYSGEKVQSYTEGSNRYSYSYGTNLVTKTDSTGSVWKYKLSDKGQRVEDTNPLGYSVTYLRDQDGYVTSSTDLHGQQQSVVRDEQDRIIAVDNGNISQV